MGFLDALHRLYNQLCAIIAGLFVGYWGAVGFHNSWAAPMRYPALGAVSGLAVFLAVLALGARGDRKRARKRVKAREAEIAWEESVRARSRTTREPESLPTWARHTGTHNPLKPHRVLTGVPIRGMLGLQSAPARLDAGGMDTGG